MSLETPSGTTAATALEPAPASSLPVPVVIDRRPIRTRRRGALLLVVAALGAAGLGGAYWWNHRAPPLPPGIAWGNGRLEADPIDVATKFAGRIVEMRVEEGDRVRAGQTVAVMDTRSFQQSLEKAEAGVQLQEKAITEAEAVLEQIRSQVQLAEQQMERTRTLMQNGWATREVYDQRSQQLRTARATEAAAAARVNQMQRALQVGLHDVELMKVNIADSSLVAPRDGQVQYRIANLGEVLPAGGKVYTLLDTNYIYMDVYLPTASAGRIKPGDDSRIVLDAWPARPIRAKVTFISPQAQFTPKTVETQSERDKLMFRVRVRIDPDQLQDVAARSPSGLPGLAYVRFENEARWPAALQGAP